MEDERGLHVPESLEKYWTDIIKVFHVCSCRMYDDKKQTLEQVREDTRQYLEKMNKHRKTVK